VATAKRRKSKTSSAFALQYLVEETVETKVKITLWKLQQEVVETLI
jgi:hypothetical protein